MKKETLITLLLIVFSVIASSGITVLAITSWTDVRTPNKVDLTFLPSNLSVDLVEFMGYDPTDNIYQSCNVKVINNSDTIEIPTVYVSLYDDLGDLCASGSQVGGEIAGGVGEFGVVNVTLTWENGYTLSNAVSGYVYSV